MTRASDAVEISTEGTAAEDVIAQIVALARDRGAVAPLRARLV
jgi:hypothetical protein